MKTRSIFEKLLSSNSTSCDKDCGSREFVAETLESRILYSAAPASPPQVEIAHEAANPAMDVDFESIDSFMIAAQNESEVTDETPMDKVSILTSFEEIGIETPVSFDSAGSEVTRWDSPAVDYRSVAAQPVEFKIIVLDKSEKAEVEVSDEGAFTDDIQSGSRLTAVRSAETEEVFADYLQDNGNIFGLGFIEQSMSDWVTLVA